MRQTLSILAVFCFIGQARSDEEDWKPFKSKEGKFSILWPGEPNVTKAKHPKTGTIKTAYQAKSPGFSIDFLSLDVADIPAEEVKKNGFEGTVKALKDGISSGLKAKVISEEKVAIGKTKHPAKDLVLEFPNKSTYARLRVCLVGERLYTVTVVGPKATVEGKQVGKMLDSFAPSN